MKLAVLSLALIPIIGNLNNLLGFSTAENLSKFMYGQEPVKTGSLWTALPPGTMPPVAPPLPAPPSVPPLDKDSYDIPDPQPKPPIPKPPIPKPPEPNPPNPDPPVPQGQNAGDPSYYSEPPFWKGKRYNC